MERRRFLWSVGGLPGLLYLSCGQEEDIIDATAAFPDDTLAAYTHPPLDLSDEFDAATLGTQWRAVSVNTPPAAIWSVSWGKRAPIEGVKVSLGEGHVRLTGRNDQTGGLALYGTYGGRKRLRGHWAMEALLELPDLDYSQTPVRAGMTIRASNEKGWGAYVELGRVAGQGVNNSFLFHEGSYRQGWTGKEGIETARRVYLRIESADEQRRAIRCGMKANKADDWSWSPVLRFSRPILWLDNAQLMNFDTRHEGLDTKPKNPPPLYSDLFDEERLTAKMKPSGEEVTVSFDYARFEGQVISLKEGVEYVRTTVPKVDMRFPEGERYEALVPDTFDIEERSRLAIHALTSLTDPNADYEIYWWTDSTRRPAVLHHDWNDNFGPRFMEGTALLRLVTGSRENRHVEQRWREVLLHMQGPDGVMYVPAVGRPWNYDTVWEGIGNREEHFMVPHVCGFILSAMTVFDFQDKTPIWREAIDKLIDGLSGMVVDKGSYAYFPYRAVGVGSRPTGREPLPTPGLQFAFAHAVVIQALSQYRRAGGSETAVELGGKLVTYVRDHGGCFGPQGEWIGFQHFPSHAFTLLGLLDFALATDDRELAEFCATAYEQGKTKAVDLVGFMPEFYGDPDYPSTELCEVAQMISLACKLSEAGLGDYWRDADRWIRNMFAEGQCLRVDWMSKYADRFPERTHANFNESSDGAAERNLGAFGGWVTGNDFWEGRMGPFMHCCTGTSASALYVIWNNILREEDDKVRVNLLMNRTSNSLDVLSYIPYEGKVEFKMKQGKRVSLRIPEWTEKRKVKCRVAGQSRTFPWQGQYIDLGKIEAGQTATVEFPIRARKAETVLGDKQYELWVKGNTVVDIKPEGKIAPLYQRDHYLGGSVRYKKVNRFCARETIDW